MKLISFLGTGDYKPATYSWLNNEVDTRFFPEAVMQWLPGISKVHLLLTDEVRNHSEKNKNWNDFSKLMRTQGLYLPDDLTNSKIVPVDIKTGKTEDELWEIFGTFVQQFSDGEEVVLDITHAFRSLPVFGLLACIFMQSVGKLKIQHILYGAFEGKDDNGVTPVYDLTQFVSLLDWTNAARQFVETGNSQQIAQQLKKNMNDTQDSTLEDNLSAISNALLLTQPHSLKKAVSQLQEPNLDNQSPRLKPFELIKQQIYDTYHQLGKVDLKTQLELIRWYCDRQHYVQAVTLAREWLISYLCQFFTKQPDLSLQQRYDFEIVINGIGRIKQINSKLKKAINKFQNNAPEERVKKELSDLKDEKLIKLCLQQVQSGADITTSLNLAISNDDLASKYQMIISQYPEIPFPNNLQSSIDFLWSKIPELRNQIAHCEMGKRDNQANPETLIAKIEKLIKDLEQFFTDNPL